ncbi:MAG TPA: TauD/TfdA family dioxygenase [Pirellulales bacterium]|nr:TauD/TfdA family dioxygenase [Pirellulales bacterium]
MNLRPIKWDGGTALAAIRQRLEQEGIVYVAAAPGDAEGHELRDIVGRLGTAEEHDRLGQFVWHIRYDAEAAERGATASLTMEPLPFHTDGAFENPSPRYLAQYVVQEDRFGGGETLLIDVATVVDRLNAATCEILRTTYFRFWAPAEYAKQSPYHDAPILFGDGLMRYRRAIIDDELRADAAAALDELDAAIDAVKPARLRLPSGAVLLFDNARFLHARTAVLDPDRHLLRMRFSCDAPVVT